MTKALAAPQNSSGLGWIDGAVYAEWYRQSIERPEAFWREHGRRIDWFKPYAKVRDVSYGPDEVHIRWFHDGTLNVAHNCLDRHPKTRGDQVAIIWEAMIRPRRGGSPTARCMRRSAGWRTG